MNRKFRKRMRGIVASGLKLTLPQVLERGVNVLLICDKVVVRICTHKRAYILCCELPNPRPDRTGRPHTFHSSAAYLSRSFQKGHFGHASPSGESIPSSCAHPNIFS